LGDFLHFAEHFTGAGLVEAHRPVGDADRFQHLGDAERGELAGEHGRDE